MTSHKRATREEWLEARLQLLDAEKAFTQRSDELAKQRQELPWVRVDKDYQFDTNDGKASLADLFKGRSQLMIYHFMFGPDYKAGCPTCSSIADGFNGITVHLKNHDLMFWAISRAPLAKLQAYEQRMGWTFPWASSFESDFNFDYSVGFTKEQMQKGAEYNFRREEGYSPKTAEQSGAFQWRKGQCAGKGAEAKFAEMTGTDVQTYHQERPGLSAFVMEDGQVYHTYSAYGRGVDAIWAMYPWFDRAPKGRNEANGPWWQRHDEYNKS